MKKHNHIILDCDDAAKNLLDGMTCGHTPLLFKCAQNGRDVALLGRDHPHIAIMEGWQDRPRYF